MKARQLFFTSLLVILPICSSLCIDMYLPAYPDLAQSFKVLPADINYSMSAYLIGMAFGQLLFGPLADRFGRRKPLIGGLILFVAATLLCAFAPNLLMFVLARFLQALGACSCIVISRTIVADVYPPKQRVTVLGLISASNILSPMLAPIFGSYLLTVADWQTIFISIFIFGIILLIGVCYLLYETLANPDLDALKIKRIYLNVRHLTSSKFFLAHLINITLLYASVFIWVNSSAHILLGYFKLPESAFGYMFVIPALGYTLGSLITVKFIHGLGDKPLLWSAHLFLMSVAIILIGFGIHSHIQSAVFCVLLMAALFFNIGIIQPILIAQAVSPFLDIAGLTMGVIGFTQACSGALMGIITSALYNWNLIGMSTLIGITVSIAFIAFTYNEKFISFKLKALKEYKE